MRAPRARRCTALPRWAGVPCQATSAGSIGTSWPSAITRARSDQPLHVSSQACSQRPPRGQSATLAPQVVAARLVVPAVAGTHALVLDVVEVLDGLAGLDAVRVGRRLCRAEQVAERGPAGLGPSRAGVVERTR